MASIIINNSTKHIPTVRYSGINTHAKNVQRSNLPARCYDWTSASTHQLRCCFALSALLLHALIYSAIFSFIQNVRCSVLIRKVATIVSSGFILSQLSCVAICDCDYHYACISELCCLNLAE